MTVCWIIIELMFLLFFFKLPTVADYVKSQYQQHVERSQQQQQQQNENSNNDEVKESLVTSINEQSDEASVVGSSLAEQEKVPLLSNDNMKDVSHYSSSQSIAQSTQKSLEDIEKNSVPIPEGLLRKAYWMLFGL